MRPAGRRVAGRKSVPAWPTGQRAATRAASTLCPAAVQDDERNTAGMPTRILLHFRHNLVAYLALFVALGGSSYAAVRLTPGSVRTRALAAGAVTHTKLALNSVTSANIANGSLTARDFSGATGPAGGGRQGAAGPAGPSGRAGGAYIGAKAHSTGSVVAPHGASTNVPITGDSWTQDAGELDLIAGTMTVKTPPACTGSYGNALVVSIDGKATTFGVPPQMPASTSVTVPLLVGTLSEPGASTVHHMTASLGNSCTKGGEDFSVDDVKLDVLKFN
jgi:hypothetical protein